MTCSAQLQMGGKRKSRRQSKKGGAKTQKKVKGGASDWHKKVMAVYRELKKKNPATKLGAAMKEASRRKKAGKL
jgi:hypothetical protein